MITVAYLAGWLLLGLVLCRIGYHAGLYLDRRGSQDSTADSIMITLTLIVFAPLLAPLAVAAVTLGGAGYGVYRLVTLPTRAERRARRLAAMEDERDRVRAEARRLGLPLVEDRDG